MKQIVVREEQKLYYILYNLVMLTNSAELQFYHYSFLSKLLYHHCIDGKKLIILLQFIFLSFHISIFG